MIFIILMCILIERGADYRHTTLSSPQATFKYGKSAPRWGSPNIESFARFFSGGD